MYVPNYIPEPSEVPGNITEEPYAARLVYIRRVAIGHLASVAVVAASSQVSFPKVHLRCLEMWTIGALLLLSLVRTLFRAKRFEPWISLALLLPTLPLVGQLAKALTLAGLQVWSACIGATCGVLYSLLCGRDFSFLGQFLLSLIVSSGLVAWVSTAAGLPTSEAAEAMGWNLAFLAYWCYDLASLLARRRPGEELAAVADLYRDVFNFIGYGIRVWHHWRKHRFWNLIRPF